MDYGEYKQKHQRTSFYDQIGRNKFRSVLLFIFIGVLAVVLMYVIAQVYNPALTILFLIIGVLFSFGYALIGFYSGDKIALATVKAKEASSTKLRHLHSMVEGLSIAAGIPKPKLYVMPSKEINAFATGRNPEHGVICVSVGALEQLNNKELEAVLAHEMGHIGNYDIRFITLTIIMVGLIAIISQVFLRSLWFSGGSSGSDKNNTIFLVIGIALAILAPIVANLVQLAVSRKREYMADATAVKLTRDNSGLISALKKIDAFYSGGGKTIATKTVSNMFLASPFSSKAASLFSTHPPIKERIKILEAM
jgi:heat shock protein HtpX